MDNIKFIGNDKRFVYAKKKLSAYKFVENNTIEYDHIVLPLKGATAMELNETTVMANKKAIYYIGNESEYFKVLRVKYNLHCIYLNDDLAFNYTNNRATAEGVLYQAIGDIPRNINHLKILVLGYGASAAPICQLFKLLGANVTVAARREEVRKKLKEEGYENINFEMLQDFIPNQDLIINTVPSLVINDELLHSIHPSSLILDVATSPGGFNHDVALALGLRAKLLPGLPAIFSPEDSGVAIAEVIIKERKNE